MSVKIMSGSIFESEAGALVNPVNTQGVCGAGLALEFKKRYPENYKDYVNLCNITKCFPGTVTSGFWESGKWIINFFTKDHFKDVSKIEWIDGGLKMLSDNAIWHHYNTIALPALGCGLGGLDWHDVRDLVLKYFDKGDGIKVELYLPKTQRTRNIFKNNPVDLLNI